MQAVLAHCAAVAAPSYLQHHTAPCVSRTLFEKVLKRAASSGPSNPPKLPGTRPRTCITRACRP